MRNDIVIWIRALNRLNNLYKRVHLFKSKLNVPVYFRRILSMSVLAYWNSLLWALKMMTEISQSQRTLSSYAFFIRPNFLLVKVTWRFLSSGMRWMDIFFLPMMNLFFCVCCRYLFSILKDTEITVIILWGSRTFSFHRCFCLKMRWIKEHI